MKPVLILSGHVISLGIVRALGAASIPVHVAAYECGDISHTSRYVDKYFRLPPPAQEAAFIKRLVEIGQALDRPMLIPGDDASLRAISSHQAVLAESFILACPSAEEVERFINKTITYQLVGAAGVPVPQTIYVNSAKEAGDAAEKLGYPCIVKPTESHFYYDHFGVKFRHVAQRSDAEAAYTEAKMAGVDTMVQEFIVGDDSMGVNYNAYAIDGETCVEFTARKVRMSPPGEGVPSLVRSAHVEEVLDLGRRALKAINFSGYSCTEFKWDAKKERYVFFEVNGRYNRSNSLATRCGINFPVLEYHHRVLGIIPVAQKFREKVWWIDEFKDLASFHRRVKLSPKNLITFWSPYFKMPECAIWALRDPKPFLFRLCLIIKSIGRKVLNRKSCRSDHAPPCDCSDKK